MLILKNFKFTPRVMHRYHWPVVLVFIFVLILQNHPGFTATLAWDANTETTVSGYKVYFGTKTRNYSSVKDVGNNTQYNLNILNREKKYYLAVTAYNNTSESPYSEEISYTVTDGIAFKEDNCPNIPNGPELGICVQDTNGIILNCNRICYRDSNCNNNETCQTDQEDANNNGIGDPCECHSDFDNNGLIGLSDFMILKIDYGSTDCNDRLCLSDINMDYQVGFFDLTILSIEYGMVCNGTIQQDN